MSQAIRTIDLPMPLWMGRVNCYLLETNNVYVLIDTACSKQRSILESQLDSAGCKRENLRLIILTHGDFDHAGNCIYLREKYGAKIAMHNDDSGMVEYGNMFWSRKKKNFIVRVIAPILFGFGKSKRFKPDLYFEDGYNLSEYGFEAQILHIPGHLKGSIGILTAGGDLFCGDLFVNSDKPKFNSLMDDMEAANASLERLKRLDIKTVYPGHGKPFPIDCLQAG